MAMAEHDPGFELASLGDALAVGAVTPTQARIWLRSSASGDCTVTATPAGGSAAPVVARVRTRRAVADGTAVAVLDGLATDARYDVVAHQGERELGRGAFRTPPAATTAPTRLAFGVMSCHQPFDDDGAVRDDARAMLAAADRFLREHDAAFLLAIGDQMYADRPPSRSLFEQEHFARVAPRGRETLHACTAAEVRAIYEQRYRTFGALPEWRTLLANRASYPMLDDHEIRDNWGSDPDHATEHWGAVRDGAVRAYLDYQYARVAEVPTPLPGSSHYSFVWGPLAVFVTDMRLPRDIARGTLFGAAQLDELARFLDRHADHPALAVVTTQPLLHVPEAAVRVGAALTPQGGDFDDRPTHPSYEAEVRRLSDLLREHRRRAPQQRLLLLAGDIHVGSVCAVRWHDEPPCHQIVSSGVTNIDPEPVPFVAKVVTVVGRALGSDAGPHVPQFELLADHGPNPYTGLHVALVELEPQHERLRLRTSLLGCEDGEARVVLRTPWL